MIHEDLLPFLSRALHARPVLVAGFPGGFHFHRAPARPQRPYLIVDLLSEAPAFSTEPLASENVAVQFTIVADEVSTARQLRHTLTRDPAEGLDFLADEPLGSDDLVVTATRTGGATTIDPDPNPDAGEAVLATVDYLFLCSRN